MGTKRYKAYKKEDILTKGVELYFKLGRPLMKKDVDLERKTDRRFPSLSTIYKFYTSIPDFNQGIIEMINRKEEKPQNEKKA